MALPNFMFNKTRYENCSVVRCMVSRVAKVEFRGRTNNAGWMSPYISSRQVYHDFQLSVVSAVLGYAPVSERRGGSSSMRGEYPGCLNTLRLVERCCIHVFISSVFIALVRTDMLIRRQSRERRPDGWQGTASWQLAWPDLASANLSMTPTNSVVANPRAEVLPIHVSE